MYKIQIMAQTIVNEEEESLNISIIIDEILLSDRYCINYGELIASVRGNGEYFILTCSCGITQCAGIYKGVEVKFINDFVEWHFVDPYPLDGKVFIFDRNLYVKAIRSGFKEVRGILRNALLQGKKFCIYPPDQETFSQDKRFLFNLFGADETIFLNTNWRKPKRYSRTSFKIIRKLLNNILTKDL